MSFFRLILIVLACFSGFVYSNEQELLKTQDINKVMAQIFQEHVDKKEMSSTIIQTALKNYIDQFDQERVYLLEDEIKPYLKISQSDLNTMVERYKRQDFKEFVQLNDLIQKSIVRARELRSEIEATKAQMFQVQQPNEPQEWLDAEKKKLFALSLDELKNRNRDYLLRFIHAEKKRYGEAYVIRNANQIFSLWEKHLRGAEDQYLYVEGKTALSSAAKENLFAMHVLKALAKSLDAHTSFFNPEEAYDMRIRLEKGFQGIGVTLQETPEGVVVQGLMAGGPAAKSGLVKVKDRVIEIDGVAVKSMELDKVMELMRGKKDSPSMTLVLVRKVDENGSKAEKTLHVQLKREAIVMNEDRAQSSYETVANGIIGKITLNSFYQNDTGMTSENDVRDAINKLEKQGNLRGLILDLRENSGGFLSQAVKVAGLFITNGIIVISKYSSGEEKFYRDMDGKMAYNGPLIILTSKATASAAEIVAQALQDYGVAVIVGDEHTYGKGTIQSQTVTENKGTSYFKVTVGKYYTVSGKTPQLQGVKADIVVPGQFSNEHIGEEYLEQSLKTDKIPAAYVDPLQDIDASLRAWYMRYYTPTVQHKQDLWKGLLPTLKKNSEYRLTHNKNFQMFLKGHTGGESVDEDEFELGIPSKKNFGADDMQMVEAVDILKDMIYMQSQVHSASHTAEK